jgi:hypothetical protein
VSSWPVTEGLFELGDPEVERGGVIRGARLAVAGTRHPNAAKDNVIVHPCSYTATHADLADLIGPDLVLDPERWFIVVPDMFSKGLSSSAADDLDFPAVVTAGQRPSRRRGGWWRSTRDHCSLLQRCSSPLSGESAQPSTPALTSAPLITGSKPRPLDRAGARPAKGSDLHALP